MKTTNEKDNKKARYRFFVTAYPVVLVLMSIGINFFMSDFKPVVISLPSKDIVTIVTIAIGLLVLNHAWIMTATELVRVNHDLRATTEEWEESGLKEEDASKAGLKALERCHNMHRNTTENTVYFALLLFVFICTSPQIHVASVWCIGFAVARLGYTYAYLKKKTGLRGIGMSLSLLSMFGMLSYLCMALI